jgi:phage shock protein PspC (stress-responsive transcriptional regulator)
MNKTNNINLSGNLFHVDEPAFEKLYSYSERLKKCYSTSVDGVDIIADVEARMSELLKIKLTKEGRTIVSIEDVDSLISQLGEPESFEENESDAAASTSNTQSTNEQTFEKKSKRLYRDVDDSVLGGICSGLSAYLGISDPIWLRIAFVIMIFFGIGSPILIYIILWFLLPEANTNAKKIEMRGGAVNLSSLESNIRSKISEVEKKNSGKLRDLIKFCIKAVFYCIAGFFLLIGAVVVFSLVIAFFSLLIATFASFIPASKFLFESPVHGTMGMIGIIFMCLAIITILILAPIHLLSKNIKPLSSKVFGLISLSAIVGFFMLVFSGISLAQVFDKKGQIKQATSYALPANDTLQITANTNYSDNDFNIGIGFDIDDYNELEKNGEICKVNVKLEKSEDTQIHVIQNKIARGKSINIAESYAKQIIHHQGLNNNKLTIDDFLITSNKNKKFRNQHVDVVIQIPENHPFKLSSDICDMLNDYPPISESTFEDENELADAIWIMQGSTMVPIKMNYVAVNDIDAKHQITNFEECTNLEFAGNLEVDIVYGENYKMYASVPENTLKIESDGNTCSIKSKKSMFFNSPIKIKIEMPELESIGSAGNSNITCKNMNGNNLIIKTAGDCKINLIQINFDNVAFNAAGAGDIKASGSSKNIDIQFAGQPNADLSKLIVNTANLSLIGESKITINASESIEGEAAGASEINYIGKPKTINIDALGGSKITSI